MVLAEVRGGSPAVVAHREGGARTRASEVQLAVVRSSARGGVYSCVPKTWHSLSSENMFARKMMLFSVDFLCLNKLCVRLFCKKKKKRKREKERKENACDFFVF